MPNIGPMEILVVLIIALIVFGPKRLPELGKSLGRGISEFHGTISGEHSRGREAGRDREVPVAVPEPRAQRPTPPPRARV